MDAFDEVVEDILLDEMIQEIEEEREWEIADWHSHSCASGTVSDCEACLDIEEERWQKSWLMS